MYGAFRQYRGRHFIQQLLLALEVPVDGCGLNVELVREAAERKLL